MAGSKSASRTTAGICQRWYWRAHRRLQRFAFSTRAATGPAIAPPRFCMCSSRPTRDGPRFRSPIRQTAGTILPYRPRRHRLRTSPTALPRSSPTIRCRPMNEARAEARLKSRCCACCSRMLSRSGLSAMLPSPDLRRGVAHVPSGSFFRIRVGPASGRGGPPSRAREGDPRAAGEPCRLDLDRPEHGGTPTPSERRLVISRTAPPSATSSRKAAPTRTASGTTRTAQPRGSRHAPAISPVKRRSMRARSPSRSSMGIVTAQTRPGPDSGGGKPPRRTRPGGGA